MKQRFLGKSVIVVGGNSGIGLAAAKAFASEGAKVVIAGRNAETLESSAKEIGEGTLTYQVDISDVKTISSLFEQVGASLGKIDALFVNSGRCSFCPIGSVTEEDWHWVQDTNLKGVFFTVQAALPLMSEPSSIVFTGSISGRLANHRAPVYAASKAGLRSLGRSLAAALVDRGIRVNVVSPGPTDTPAYERARKHEDDVPTILEDEVGCIPMKRMGTPEEVAEAVLFLASEDSSFTTGTELLVDGGEASF